MMETINVSTQEGRDMLARIAQANGPLFRVRHACDTREDGE
jgi:hypothetical protein